jgi:hypothetical protein
MTVSKWSQLAVLAALLGSSSAALATEPMHPQTHHCKLSDGSMDMKKTHKQCTAAKGTWAKDAPAATAPKPATPAPATPAPATPAPAAPAPTK